MNIAFNGVLYNNFKDVLRFLDSLILSFYSSDVNIVSIKVNIINNGKPLNELEIEEINRKTSDVELIKINLIEGHGNIGYFPGVRKGIEYSISSDIFVICNFDLELSRRFFYDLKNNYSVRREIFAPRIYSIVENKDRNPKILVRPSIRSMFKYQFLFSIPYFHHFYKRFLYSRKQRVEIHYNGSMYAPHGSFIILNNCEEVIQEILSYPIFLFGEEIHLGEVARKYNIPVLYKSNIEIIDHDHASTSLESEAFIRKNNLKAINYLKLRYWK